MDLYPLTLDPIPSAWAEIDEMGYVVFKAPVFMWSDVKIINLNFDIIDILHERDCVVIVTTFRIGGIISESKSKMIDWAEWWGIKL